MRLTESRYSKLIAIGALAVLIALGCGIWLWLRPAGPRPKHVLILSIESLRWDHLGFAGYARPTSPNIDKLVARGTCFRRAYAQAPWTRPSVASTFTSTYPSTHNAANDRQFGMALKERPGGIGFNESGVLAPLVESFVTMAEMFTEHGFDCFGWSSNPQITKKLGFGQGFEEYDATGESFLERILVKKYGSKDRIPPGLNIHNVRILNFRGVIDEMLVDRLKELYSRTDRGPTMVFVHFMSPHLPYLPVKKVFVSGPEGVAIDGPNLAEINRGDVRLSEADIAYNIDLYDATIRETDTRVGRILRVLEESGVADETLVVLAADHGEEFYDHGKVGHGHTVYEELIRVPLVLAGPGIPPGESVSVPVQNIDLLPTMAGLLWDEKLPGGQGRDLRHLLGPQREGASADPVFSEHGGRPGSLCAVIDGSWKLIARMPGEEIELYDLAGDPGEKTDLSGDPAQQGRVARLAALVGDFVAANLKESAKYERSGPVKVSDDLLRQMRALGYLK